MRKSKLICVIQELTCSRKWWVQECQPQNPYSKPGVCKVDWEQNLAHYLFLGFFFCFVFVCLFFGMTCELFLNDWTKCHCKYFDIMVLFCLWLHYHNFSFSFFLIAILLINSGFRRSNLFKSIECLEIYL